MQVAWSSSAGAGTVQVTLNPPANFDPSYAPTLYLHGYCIRETAGLASATVDFLGASSGSPVATDGVPAAGVTGPRFVGGPTSPPYGIPIQTKTLFLMRAGNGSTLVIVYYDYG